MYTISQAQYDQLMQFSKQAAEVQELLKSLQLVPATQSEVEQDKKFRRLLFQPYYDHENSPSCVPLCKQWDPLDNPVYKERMIQLLTSAFGQYHDNTFKGLFDILRKAGAVIAGSAALACVIEDSSFTPGDVDIFFPGTERGENGMTQMHDYLTTRGLNVTMTYPGDTPQFHKALCAENVDELNGYQNNLGVQTIVNCDIHQTSRRIQLIQLAQCKGMERTHIRTFIRKFDLSCCQVFFDGITFFVRSLYRHLTLKKFMLVNKFCDAKTDAKLVERINKYKQRGFKAYTLYPTFHNEVATDGVKVLQTYTDSNHSMEHLELMVKQQLSREQSILALTTWCELALTHKSVSKIGNDTKHELSNLLKAILASPTIILDESIHNVFNLLFQLKDIRWLLLILVDDAKFSRCFTAQSFKLASEANFARDNLQLFRNKVIAKANSYVSPSLNLIKQIQNMDIFVEAKEEDMQI